MSDEAERLGARRCRDADGVTVTVNGRAQETAPGETVESLLDSLGLAAPYALVERNGEPVERNRYGVTASRVFLLDQVKGIAVGVSTLGNPDLERAHDGRRAHERRIVRFDQRETAKSQRTIVENGLAGSDVAYRRDHRTFTAARRTLAFAWRRRGPGDLSMELPNNFADGFFQGDPVLRVPQMR